MKETALLPRAINGIKQLGDALVSQSSSKLAKAIGLEEPDGGDHELRDFAADNFMVVPGRVVHLRHLTSADPSHPTAEVREPTAFSEIKLSLPRMFTDHTPLSVSTARAADGGLRGGTDALVGCPARSTSTRSSGCRRSGRSRRPRPRRPPRNRRRACFEKEGEPLCWTLEVVMMWMMWS